MSEDEPKILTVSRVKDREQAYKVFRKRHRYEKIIRIIDDHGNRVG